jgi:PAS domain-containing protein
LEQEQCDRCPWITTIRKKSKQRQREGETAGSPINQPKIGKAIEQLRLANGALHSTNQELWSLNTQLEMLNQEVEMLTEEVVRLRAGHMRTLDHVPYPVVLPDKDGKIEVWNAAAQQLFNLAPDASVDSRLDMVRLEPCRR